MSGFNVKGKTNALTIQMSYVTYSKYSGESSTLVIYNWGSCFEYRSEGYYYYEEEDYNPLDDHFIASGIDVNNRCYLLTTDGHVSFPDVDKLCTEELTILHRPEVINGEDSMGHFFVGVVTNHHNKLSLEYAWFHNGNPLCSGPKQSITKVSEPGTYYCKVQVGEKELQSPNVDVSAEIQADQDEKSRPDRPVSDATASTPKKAVTSYPKRVSAVELLRRSKLVIIEQILNSPKGKQGSGFVPSTPSGLSIFRGYIILSKVIRWIDEELEAHEDFLGFVNIPNICADTIVAVIKDLFSRLTLSLNNMRGKCYDGASNMLGNLVQHHGHRKRGQIKENLEYEDESSASGNIVSLCPTRWTVGATCFRRILENYSALLEALKEALSNNLQPDVKGRIVGCQAQMQTFDFLFGLSLGELLLSHSGNLSRTLQSLLSTKMSAVSGQRLAQLTKFCTFRKALDAEMREATKLGVTQATQKEHRENITEEEEALFWKLKLLGNSIIFDETLSKTFHGGLKDLKKGKRIVNHQCHGEGKQHSPCLLAMYSMYLELVKDIAPKVECFYCRPKRDGSMGYEKSAVGISTLNKILPEKLCDKARIPRKTSHCLRITCATSLFQNGVEEKLIRERTGHTSNALLRYQLPSLKQIETASAVLGPSIATEQKGEESVAKREWEVDKCTKTVPSSNSLQLNDFEYDVPDELLADVCLPESASLGSSDNFQFDLSDEMLASIPNSIWSNTATNAIFNNCNVSFNFNFK
ncbi:hypothetical protein AC249_AIPGENE28260 [Exaiptasia diaphana]|nr:hypothetical protein AC249_AIPGENE28260 [Exaiptasia diaphana]